jgi:hypothetical protein
MTYSEGIFDRYSGAEARQAEEELLRFEEDLRIRMSALDSAAKVADGTMRLDDTSARQEVVVLLAQRFERYLRTGK